ncbi:hypothetical protein PIB30_039464 [Stylosanthes scabra]|uniref:Uncharacterized protein n=1 Tax=Stylosanthes scabra TaxID=79078 RepID=A0ABU6VEB9_9FABA|nr:hypothetical protein [Stylosanthes scabra]
MRNTAHLPLKLECLSRGGYPTRGIDKFEVGCRIEIETATHSLNLSGLYPLLTPHHHSPHPCPNTTPTLLSHSDTASQRSPGRLCLHCPLCQPFSGSPIFSAIAVESSSSSSTLGFLSSPPTAISESLQISFDMLASVLPSSGDRAAHRRSLRRRHCHAHTGALSPLLTFGLQSPPSMATCPLSHRFRFNYPFPDLVQSNCHHRLTRKHSANIDLMASNFEILGRNGYSGEKGENQYHESSLLCLSQTPLWNPVCFGCKKSVGGVLELQRHRGLTSKQCQLCTSLLSTKAVEGVVLNLSKSMNPTKLRQKVIV